VTKVKVKDNLIEFQLGGGGYGTFGDDASSHVSVPVAGKSVREKNLERDIPGAPGSQSGETGGRELRKGLTVEEVDAILGRPETITQRTEGTLTASTSLYRSRDRRVTAEFVEGVLIRFTITSP